MKYCGEFIIMHSKLYVHMAGGEIFHLSLVLVRIQATDSVMAPALIPNRRVVAQRWETNMNEEIENYYMMLVESGID